MKNIIITEEEKKQILNNYGISSNNNTNLISEHEKISKLMGIKTTKGFLFEGSGKYTWWTDLPGLSGWKTTFDNVEMSAIRQSIDGDMDLLSRTLKEKGINGTNISNKAYEWWQNTMKAVGEVPDGGTLVEKYLRANHPNALLEINNNLAKLAKESTESKVDDLIEEFRQFDESPELINGKVRGDIDDFDESGIDGVIENSSKGAEYANNKASELSNEARIERQKGNADMADELEAQAKKWRDLAKGFNDKANYYKKWKDVHTKYQESLPTNVKIIGPDGALREVDMSGMNVIQRWLWSNAIKGTLPLEFFYSLGRLMQFMFFKRNYTDMMLGDVSGLINAMRTLGDEGQTTFDAYASRIRSTMGGMIGRAGTKPGSAGANFNLGTLLKEGFGFGIGAKTMEQEWARFTKVLDASVGLTQSEKQQIKELVKQRYMLINNKEQTSTSIRELSDWRGWAFFNEDIQSVAGKALENEKKEIGNALNSTKKTYLSKDTNLVDDIGQFLKQLFVGDVFKNAVIAFFSNLFRKSINLLVVGIPGGLKWTLRPILNRGITLRGVAESLFKLWVSKVAFISFSAGITYIYNYIKYLQEYYGVKEVAGEDTGKEYKKKIYEVWKSQMSTAFDVTPYYDIDYGWEKIQEGEPDIPQNRRYDAGIGIFNSYGLMWFKEMDAEVFTDENINVKEITDKKQEEWVNKFWDRSTREQQEAVKEQAGFNNIKKVSEPNFRNLSGMGLTRSQAKSIQRKLFFKPLPVNSAVIPAKVDDINPKTLGGITFLCDKDLVREKGGIVCSGNPIRIAICNDIYFDNDDVNYKKYIYNKDTKTEGSLSGKYKGKLVYIKNKNMVDSAGSKLPIGNDVSNIGLVSELPFL